VKRFTAILAMLIVWAPLLAEAQEPETQPPEEGAEGAPEAAPSPEAAPAPEGEAAPAPAEGVGPAPAPVPAPAPTPTPAPAAAPTAEASRQDEFYADSDAEETEPAEPAEGEADAGADVSLTSSAERPSRFRNSTFTYENTFSARPAATDLSAAATFYYAMSYDFRPRLYLSDWAHLRARFLVEQELSNADTTTYLYEPLASDLTLYGYFTDVLDSVTDWVDLGAYVMLTVPTSKASLARTLVLGTTAAIQLAREFDVLAGLGLTYTFEFTKYWNRYTTAVQSAPTLACTPGASMDCDSQINLGARNPSWLFRNNFGISFSPIENLTFSVDVLWYTYLLYPVTEADCLRLYADVVSADPSACPIEPAETNTDLRVSLWYIVEIGYDILPWLNVAVGTSTFNPQLTPDSEYRAPFFNRYTNIYLDININADELVRSIMRRATRRRADEV
jgi:hypothetical protein